MNKSFEIGQSNEVIEAGKVCDLRNLYDFVGIVLRTKEKRLQLLFEPNSEHGKGQLAITLNFEGIDYLEFSPNFGARAISSLDEIGYESPEDRDDEWLMSEHQATRNDHFLFRLPGGDFIRIHCRNAGLAEKNPRSESSCF